MKKYSDKWFNILYQQKLIYFLWNLTRNTVKNKVFVVEYFYQCMVNNNNYNSNN